MARNQKHYDTDYKVQSVNLAKEIGLVHRPKRNPKGITKADRKRVSLTIN